MKKLFAVLLLVALALPVFANDATVLPAGVLRARVIPTYAFGDKKFDSNGDSQDLGMDVSIINLGAAVEYGINDWMTAGVQWAPGWNLWSKFDPDPLGAYAKAFNPASDVTTNLNGLSDIKVGLAIQIVGAKAPLASDMFRFVATPAVIIPLPGADGAEQAADLAAAIASGDSLAVTYADPDKHAFGFGGRLSGDLVVNKMFYLNLCGEFTKYLEKKDAYISAYQATKMDIAYGYKLTGEFEPHFVYDLGNNSNLSASLPVTFNMWPKTEYNGAAAANTDGYSLSLSPTVGYFFFAGPLPMELSANYAFPVMGKNVVMALNSATLQIKTFLKF